MTKLRPIRNEMCGLLGINTPTIIKVNPTVIKPNDGTNFISITIRTPLVLLHHYCLNKGVKFAYESHITKANRRETNCNQPAKINYRTILHRSSCSYHQSGEEQLLTAEKNFCYELALLYRYVSDFCLIRKANPFICKNICYRLLPVHETLRHSLFL